ncbi:hypothetical protein M441DRAFT_139127 [Trichoderma asperellum CBS 433.97]|uniref:Uncharacterized protein n=1 Tax=Trichoderma asperellum (strain ATCC 204424 / CBS 433.97 / NBRC 101777) TaxID=1042311 RepID=A0A2T3ZA89_TRIA4|nr:hypothetical protein M441DRAFT_139127 [Trichoderma asperellum CBS 433.97]PTB41700.1 hypothetical protein M441DRAFT_139127 [Trichoderma asperellum CBS 433.97]
MSALKSNLTSERNSVNSQTDGAPHSIPATEYSTAWACSWTDTEFGILTDADLHCLAHVNCSYLSSGRPPTLLALKQHAQALTNLIRMLCLSNTFGIVDGGEKRQPVFEKNEALDWLKDLDKPYTNDDESHHLPLWALANQIEGENEETGIECHCPIKIARNFGPLEEGKSTRRPYSSHHNLVMHANACLEILDHEYSATGGLLSLLPSGSEEDSEQMQGVRNTVLGQWLLHQQHLIARMHELEINYANALDLLNGEAVVPMQMLGRFGPDGRSKGRELAYPQDRFVLANSGDDVFDLVHRLMDKAESKIQEKEQIWWESGVSGERMWMKDRGGDWYSRGLVPVDLMTRFVRLKDHGDRSTIFVLPAIEQHPATAQTRKMESRPTVVSVVAPSWPERTSDIEQRANAQIERMKELEEANRALMRDKMEMEEQMATLLADLRRTRHEVKFYEGTSEDGTRAEIIAEMAAMKRQMAKLREALPQEYHQLLEAED